MSDVRQSGVIWWRPPSSRRNEWYKRCRAWKKQFAVGFVGGQGIERVHTAEASANAKREVPRQAPEIVNIRETFKPFKDGIWLWLVRQ
jgi:hypothetical protein